uniref:Secreted protein n=1 Tax=Trichuris muris TaxID=70415 RepID=A0A5S6Q963_TRIMR
MAESVPVLEAVFPLFVLGAGRSVGKHGPSANLQLRPRQSRACRKIIGREGHESQSNRCRKAEESRRFSQLNSFVKRSPFQRHPV